MLVSATKEQVTEHPIPVIHDTPSYLSHTAPTLQANSQAPKQHSLGKDHAATSPDQLDFCTAQAALENNNSAQKPTNREFHSKVEKTKLITINS